MTMSNVLTPLPHSLCSDMCWRQPAHLFWRFRAPEKARRTSLWWRPAAPHLHWRLHPRGQGRRPGLSQGGEKVLWRDWTGTRGSARARSGEAAATTTVWGWTETCLLWWSVRRIELCCVASNVAYYILFMFSFLPQSTYTAIEKYNAIFGHQASTSAWFFSHIGVKVSNYHNLPNAIWLVSGEGRKTDGYGASLTSFGVVKYHILYKRSLSKKKCLIKSNWRQQLSESLQSSNVSTQPICPYFLSAQSS